MAKNDVNFAIKTQIIGKSWTRYVKNYKTRHEACR